VGASYHQFCPVAKAMEILDERWTLLLIRELVAGSDHFNDLRRGLPRMSPSLLSKRLRQLERAGILDRTTSASGIRYVLSPAGLALRPVVEALGSWGMRWIGELGDEDLDPSLLLWDMRRNVNHDAIPRGRTVVKFTFSDVPAAARHWWLVITPHDADVCDLDPGYGVTVTLTSSLRMMTEIWRGDLTWSSAVGSGALDIDGPAADRRAIPAWFTLASFASVAKATGPRIGDP
jgi:DNA-binding HxlR family transcriptional regulator